MIDDFEDDRAVERLTAAYLDPDYDPVGRLKAHKPHSYRVDMECVEAPKEENDEY